MGSKTAEMLESWMDSMDGNCYFSYDSSCIKQLYPERVSNQWHHGDLG
ncbi:hypothetical protein SEUBUCD646_0O01780 [Saccharomyces eubayanus]|uniref:Uncharacterized protein n=1 Tax=Saccharomyces eubayanus TaxID=1080349 RepID=A0ABN8VH98_SACEU|nr:hypothetical protein SEUBUCD650_0O01770 [Saccharomyces eubayanus]CAI1751221.1 hypothetical protein SEUBUCD646_0O01780 [Saccharomyces eubayanus]